MVTIILSLCLSPIPYTSSECDTHVTSSYIVVVIDHTKTYVATEYPAHDRTNLLIATWNKSGSSSPN